MNYSIGICTVSEDNYLIKQLDHVLSLISTIQSSEDEGSNVTKDSFSIPPRSPRDVFKATTKQAESYLKRAGKKHQFSFTQQIFSTADEAAHYLKEDESTFDLFILDSRQIPSDSTNYPLSVSNRLFERLISLSGTSTLTPYSRVMMVPENDMGSIMSYVDGSARVQVLQNKQDIDQANLLKLFIDHVEHGYLNKLLSRTANTRKSPIGLAQAIFSYMQNHWYGRWDFQYYTGSMVANLIRSMQELCSELTGEHLPRCLTGNNEHCLAAGALAGWQLFGRAYVISITSGMIDEFRGTLANLQRARAPGIIICADSPDNSWFAFQGTIDADADGREVIAARRIPHVYLHDLNCLPEQLAHAFDVLNENPGPVFIIATPNVLESRERITVASRDKTAPQGESASCDQDHLDSVMELINNTNIRLLWNCGPLSERQRSLIYEIAREAGIGLADLLTHPGAVQAYVEGKKNDNYVGTSGVYAFSRRVYHYLHEDGKLGGEDSLSQFFLKSKIDQAATPFSEGRLKRSLHIVQVNSNKRHLSPYSDVALQMHLTEFLTYVRAHLDVNPGVKKHRLEHLARVRALDEGVPIDYLATLPMSANYFTLRLGQQIQQLIEQENYRFVGVYDVGRCGLSALRNVPRTDRGFSGWYGRALMGDALSALPYIARTSSQNILAFIGDGARALVPNIEQQLVEAWSQNPNGSRINISLFYLCNGVLSMIQTYLDKRTPSGCGRQVTLPLPLHESYPQHPTETATATTAPLHRIRLYLYDEEQINELVTQPGRINVAEVILSHNSDGDGLSLFSESSWHRITA